MKNVMTWVGGLSPAVWVWAVGSIVAGLLLLPAVRVAVRLVREWRAKREDRDETPSGSGLYYLGAAMALGFSADTSWRFFRDVVGIESVPERIFLFAVIEVLLLAAGFAMHASVKNHGVPDHGSRVFMWVLASFSAFTAFQVSDFGPAVARVGLGPVVGIWALHRALKIEVLRANPDRMTTWGKLVAELRERLLSRLGLANDGRDAIMLTRDRAARRLAWLITSPEGRFPKIRQRRINRALRSSDIAHDPMSRARMLAELAVVKHVGELATLDQASPWEPAAESATATAHPDVQPAVQPAARSAVQSAVQPAVQSAVQSDVQSAVRPGVQADVQFAAVAAEPATVEQPAVAARPRVQPVMVQPSTSPAKDRARAAARSHHHRTGHLPTVTELVNTAQVSRGTAGTALQELRDKPADLHLVDDENQLRNSS
ncbi:hypothetical protein [Actinokineospora sp.]|uniref:hypothetical protein n=1 Tax=Actinokineospora sp. TaxID=1872133 RepID=UPI003D6BF253